MFPRGAPASKMMRLPSGDQLGVRTHVIIEVKSVSFLTAPLSTFTVQTFQTPSRRAANAICFPSADQE